MTLAATWKVAKTLFETTTGKKKPSATFLGVFRESSGIESALKAADAAKTTADLNKALTKFNTASAAYVKLLTKTASDPKSVPAADKAAYVLAIKKLQQGLEKIEADAGNIANALGGESSKERVDTSKLKAFDEHLKLRLRGVIEAEGVHKKFEELESQADDHLAKAAKQLTQAEKAGKSGDRMGHDVAVGVIARYVDEVKKLVNEAKALYEAKVLDGGSTFMQARMDPAVAGVPDATVKSLLPKSKEAFRKMAATMAKVNTLYSAIQGKVDEIKAVRAKAEGAGGALKSAEQYEAQLNKVLTALTGLKDSLKIKGDRVIKGEAIVAAFKNKADDNQLKVADLQLGQWERYEPEVAVARKRFGVLRDQATALPKAAREAPAVLALIKQVEVAAKEAIAYCDSVDVAGRQLTLSVKKLRGGK